MSYPPQSAVLTGTHVTSAAPRLLDEVRRHLRVKHYSLRTEATYVAWIKRFIFASGKRHPREMGALEVERFLSHLAVERAITGSEWNGTYLATSH